MKPKIIDIPGIGPAAAAALGKHGIKSLTDLARSSVEKVTAVPGFSEARAVKVIADATGLGPASAITPSSSGNSAETAAKTSNKNKKDKKKDKSKRKDKEKKKDKGKDKKKGKGKSKGKGKGKNKGKK